MKNAALSNKATENKSFIYSLGVYSAAQALLSLVSVLLFFCY